MDEETMATATTALELVREQAKELIVHQDFKVTTVTEAEDANAQLGKIKSLQKQVEAARKSETEPLRQQVLSINARYAEPAELLIRAEGTIKTALLGFRNAEEKRIEAQRKLEQEAAAKERARLEEQARKEREKAEVKAAELRAKGQDEKADATIQVAESRAMAAEQVAAMVAAPIQETAPSKLAGAAFREVWDAKVTDPRQFLQSLLASPYDIEEIVSFKAAGMKKLAGTLKGKMDAVLPGSIAWPEQTIAARAR